MRLSRVNKERKKTRRSVCGVTSQIGDCFSKARILTGEEQKAG